MYILLYANPNALPSNRRTLGACGTWTSLNILLTSGRLVRHQYAEAEASNDVKNMDIAGAIFGDAASAFVLVGLRLVFFYTC